MTLILLLRYRENFEFIARTEPRGPILRSPVHGGRRRHRRVLKSRGAMASDGRGIRDVRRIGIRAASLFTVTGRKYAPRPRFYEERDSFAGGKRSRVHLYNGVDSREACYETVLAVLRFSF